MSDDPIQEYCRNDFHPTNTSMKLKRPRAPFTIKHWCPWIRIPGEEAKYLYTPYTYEYSKPKYSANFMTKLKHFFSKAGFYHNTLVRNTWNITWRFIVKQSGNPPLPIESKTKDSTEIEEISTEILVIGGGKAGITLSNTLSTLLEKPILLIEEENIGGITRYLNKIEVHKEIELLEKTSYLGVFDDGYLALNREKNKLYKITPKTIVFATGARDALPLFENNDLPGIISSELTISLYYKYNCLNKKKIAILGDDELAKIIAEKLSEKNEVVLISRQYINQNKDEKYATIHNTLKIKAKGYPKIKKLLVETKGKKKVTIEIDYLVSAAARHPSIEALLQHGLQPTYSATNTTITVESLPGGRTRIENIYVTGEVSGTPLSLVEKEAEATAYIIASDLKSRKPDPKKYSTAKEIYIEKRLVPINKAIVQEKPAFWYETKIKGMQFLCPCEDITLEDIYNTWKEGFRKLEKIKRYTALGTGPCQGKLCHTNTILLLSYLTEKTIGEIGTFRQRPPLEPVEFKYLSAIHR